jgi:hypothetical protein
VTLEGVALEELELDGSFAAHSDPVIYNGARPRGPWRWT